MKVLVRTTDKSYVLDNREMTHQEWAPGDTRAVKRMLAFPEIVIGEPMYIPVPYSDQPLITAPVRDFETLEA